MNLKDVSTQLLFTTIPIVVERDDGGQVGGTGFFYSIPLKDKPNQTVPFIVTNRHVVENGKQAVFEFVERSGTEPKIGSPIRAIVPRDALTKFISPTADLAAVPVGGFMSELEQAGKPVYMRSISPDIIPKPEVLESLAAIEDVTFVGYPSGVYDRKNLLPLVRRGITATPAWSDFQGEPVFLIDAGVFPGSSGSPVFLLNQGAYVTPTGLSIGNRLFFLGVLSEVFLHQTSPMPPAFLGIGKVVKSHVLRSFMAEVAAKLVNEPLVT
jgi:hypothetical protein